MEQGTWACSACTYENDASFRSCEICHNLREVQLRTKRTAAPPNSLASIISKGLPSNTNSPIPVERSQPQVKSKPSQDISGGIYTIGLQGNKIQLKECAPGEKIDRFEEFHIIIKNLPGSLTSSSVAHQIDLEAQPFLIKRVVVRYFAEDPGEKRYSSTSKLLPKAREAFGPGDQDNLKARTFIEFFPAKGLRDTLRKLVGFGHESLLHKDTENLWINDCVVVPFFTNHEFGAGGIRLCEKASQFCKRKGCRFAHEPEGWGVIRFDGQPSEVSTSPQPAESAKSNHSPAKQNNTNVDQAINCRTCGKQIPNNNSNTTCDECELKTVQKVECPICLQKVDRKDIGKEGCCPKCLEEDTIGIFKEKIVGQHHVRVLIESDTVGATRENVVLYLESAIGKVKEIEEVTEYRTSKGYKVVFVQWNYDMLAGKIRQLIPPRGVTIIIEDHPNQLRVETLFTLIPTITPQEFSVLEQFYRQT